MTTITETDSFVIEETEDEQRRLLYRAFHKLDKFARREEAVKYAAKLTEAQTARDFREMQKVWNGLGTRRFGRKDYFELVKPIIDSDMALVKESVERMAGAKNVGHLASLAKLSRPVVPPAYHLWKVNRDRIGLEMLKTAKLVNKKLHREGGVISNTVVK